jgi:iron complex transport system ATP-binding protein
MDVSASSNARSWHNIDVGALMAVGDRIFAAGNPESVLTVENIRHAYGVEALVKSDGERPYIIPV